MPLLDYINANFAGNQSEFARYMGVSRQKVNKWISDGWVVVGGMLYSPRRSIPEGGGAMPKSPAERKAAQSIR